INGTAVTLAGNSTIIDMTGTGTLGLNTTTNRAITTGTGTFTTGANLLVKGNTTLGDAASDTINVVGSVNSDLNFLDADTTSYTIAGADASTTTGDAGSLTIRSGAGGTVSGNGGNLVLAAGTVISGTAGDVILQTNGSEVFRAVND